MDKNKEGIAPSPSVESEELSNAIPVDPFRRTRVRDTVELLKKAEKDGNNTEALKKTLEYVFAENRKWFSSPPQTFLGLPLSPDTKESLFLDSLSMHYMFGDVDCESSFCNEPTELWYLLWNASKEENKAFKQQDAISKILEHDSCSGIESIGEILNLNFHCHMAIIRSYFQWLFARSNVNEQTCSQARPEQVQFGSIKDLELDNDDFRALHWMLSVTHSFAIDIDFVCLKGRAQTLIDLFKAGPVRAEEYVELASGPPTDAVHPLMVYALLAGNFQDLKMAFESFENEVLERMRTASTSIHEQAPAKLPSQGTIPMKSITDIEHAQLRCYWLKHSLGIPDDSILEYVNGIGRQKRQIESLQASIRTLRKRIVSSCQARQSFPLTKDWNKYEHRAGNDNPPLSPRYFEMSTHILNRIREAVGKPPVILS